MITAALNKLNSEPWLIRQETHTQYLESLRLSAEKDIRSFFFTEELPPLEPLAYNLTHLGQRTVANISIQGPIIRKAEDWEKRWYGVVDPEEVGALIENAANDTKVHSILLHIDSPGGTAIGTPELAAIVDQVDQIKPIIGHVNGLCCSAAYYIASQCRHIVATQSSQIGCVGTYMALLDWSKAYEQAGLKREVIKNTDGTHKAAGIQGTSLTDEQRAKLQAQVDEITRDFTAAITTARGDTVSRAAFDGFSYTAAESLNLGLIDAIGTAVQALTLASKEE